MADDDIHFSAAALLIVHRVVFDIAEHMLCLFATNSVANQRSGEDRVFSHVFEGAAVARFAGQVYATAKSHVVALGAKLPANQRTVFTRSLRIPARGGSNIRWQCRGITAVDLSLIHI